MFELTERMPGMRSAEYQITSPLKFFIIIHNYANVQTINQSKSLRGFRVVSDVTGQHKNGSSIQTLLRLRKRLELSNRMNFRLNQTSKSTYFFTRSCSKFAPCRAGFVLRERCDSPLATDACHRLKRFLTLFRVSKSMGWGSRERVSHEVLSLAQGVGRAIFSYA